MASYLSQHLCSANPTALYPSIADDTTRYTAGQASLTRVLDLLKSASKRELRILELGEYFHPGARGVVAFDRVPDRTSRCLLLAGTGIGLVSLFLASMLPAPSAPPTDAEPNQQKLKHSFYATDLGQSVFFRP